MENIQIHKYTLKPNFSYFISDFLYFNCQTHRIFRNPATWEELKIISIHTTHLIIIKFFNIFIDVVEFVLVGLLAYISEQSDGLGAVKPNHGHRKGSNLWHLNGIRWQTGLTLAANISPVQFRRCSASGRYNTKYNNKKKSFHCCGTIVFYTN